jgi:hypothetical protein
MHFSIDVCIILYWYCSDTRLIPAWCSGVILYNGQEYYVVNLFGLLGGDDFFFPFERMQFMARSFVTLTFWKYQSVMIKSWWIVRLASCDLVWRASSLSHSHHSFLWMVVWSSESSRFQVHDQNVAVEIRPYGFMMFIHGDQHSSSQLIRRSLSAAAARLCGLNFSRRTYMKPTMTQIHIRTVCRMDHLPI